MIQEIDYVNKFFDDLRAGGMDTIGYLEQQGASKHWIESLINRVENASLQEFDFMKNDLRWHFNLVETKDVKAGKKWRRNAPKNITMEMMNCKDCQGKFNLKHMIDMHPTLFLYIGNGTDNGIEEDTIQFSRITNEPSK